MPAGIYDIIIEQGATFNFALIWRDPSGMPINLTGYTARMQVRQTVTQPDPAPLSLTTENGGITLGGPAGPINVLATPVQTAGLSFRAGVYDLELVSPGGEVTRLVQGSVVVSPEVTR